MKKELIITTILSIILVLFINIYSYISYRTKTNQFVNAIVEEIVNENESIEESNLIKIINSKTNKEMNTLKKYGFTSNDISILKSIEETFYQNLVISIIILILFLAIIMYIFTKKEKAKTKEINKIINYLKDLNHGIYNLDIIDNEEGITSILKNEIYTTTIILREKALQELEDKKNLKDSLSNISHQLKTPLTSILIMLDNLIDENVDEKTKNEFLNDIRYQIENINFLIMVMLKLSRFDANVIKFKSEKIKVQELLIECLKNIDIIRELKNINIHIKGKSDITFIGDYKWEVEALTNIIKNAIEYTPEGKNIYITYEGNSIYTKVVIIDEGPGISDEDIQNIFRRFYKGALSNSNNFGIGLSLAKEIIEHDNGSIKVQKIKEGGTKFIIKYYH